MNSKSNSLQKFFKSGKKPSAYIALIAAVCFWGATVPIMKVTLEHIPVFQIAFIRFALATIILLPFVVKKLKINLKDLPLVLTTGLIGVTLHILTLFFGIKQTTAVNAGLIIGTAPIFTFLLAHIFLRERLHRNIIIASILGLAGIAIVILHEAQGEALSLSPKGDILIIVSMISFVMYEILSKKLFKKYEPITVTFHSFAIGAISFLPFALSDFANNSFTTITTLPNVAIFGIFYGVFVSSLTAYSLWEWGLSKVEASKVGFFLYLDPIVAVLGAVLFLSERLTVPLVIGACFILFGVFLSQIHFPHTHAHRPRHK